MKLEQKRYKDLSIDATTLPDAWFQVVYNCLEQGRDFKIDRGSFEGGMRLEFDYFTVNIRRPSTRPLLPKIPGQYNLPDPVPGGMEYVNDYTVNYLMGNEVEPGESYTYGQRITKYPIAQRTPSITFVKDIHIPELCPMEKDKLPPFIIKEAVKDSRGHGTTKLWNFYVNQMELVIWTYKNKGYRNNQMVMQVAHPADVLLKDPPCLRQIDTRIQDGKLHFIVYFRSWDLWAGFPANLAAIQQMKEYMANEIGVEDGSLVASSKGLHLYSYVWELAEIIRGKTIKEFRDGR